MLVNGIVPKLSTISTVNPMPKDKDINFSENCRAISVGTVLCKIIDLIIINRCGDLLVFSPNQFAFKAKS